MTSPSGPSTPDPAPSPVLSGAGVSSDVSGAIGGPGVADAPVAGPSDDAAQRRRISYFMLFRLAVLTVFTGLASILAYSRDDGPGDANTGFVVGTLVVGFALTIFFARQLPRVADLQRFAWLQTTTDIVLAAAVVGMTGGADSGFQWLFLIAVLGAATMGGQRMTWAAAGACLMIVIVVGVLQWTGVFTPSLLGEPLPRLSGVVLWSAVGRTTAAILGVTILTSYLGRQLSTSVSQVGELRVLNENIVRSLSSGLVSVDTAGRILYFNPAAAELLQLSADDTGAAIDSVLPGLQAARIDGSDRVELTVPIDSGEVHLGLSQVPLRDGSGERIGDLINFTDLTRLKELTEQVRRHERLAALGGLAASVAHEIRNPLTAISGSAELLGATPNLDPQDTRLLAVIQREASRLDTLISDLLAFTRPKPPQRVKLSLATSIREISDAFAADARGDDVDISLRVIEDVPVFVDPAQISQVLWNLIRNAAEAMDANGRIDIELSGEAGECVVAISDSGPGIPEERLGRIFDPFFTTKEHGTGFGLAIVHRVVQDNGGQIDVASPPGSGARFEIRFPAADPNRAEVSGVLSVEPPRPPVA